VKESEDDDNNYMGLVRKPKLSSQDSYKPSWPTTKIIPPMMLHKVDQYDTVDSSGGGSNDDALLRRPTVVPDHNVSSTSKPSLQGTSEISSKIKNVSPKLASVAPLRKPSVGLPATGVGSMMSPPVIEEEGRVQGSEMSEERFTHLLELASSPNDSRDQVYYLFPVCFLSLSLYVSLFAFHLLQNLLHKLPGAIVESGGNSGSCLNATGAAGVCCSQSVDKEGKNFAYSWFKTAATLPQSCGKGI
jgi:hypothetical protein